MLYRRARVRALCLFIFAREEAPTSPRFHISLYLSFLFFSASASSLSQFLVITLFPRFSISLYFSLYAPPTDTERPSSPSSIFVSLRPFFRVHARRAFFALFLFLSSTPSSSPCAFFHYPLSLSIVLPPSLSLPKIQRGGQEQQRQGERCAPSERTDGRQQVEKGRKRGEREESARNERKQKLADQ